MSEELNTLIKKRGSVKAQLTQFTNYLKKIQGDEENLSISLSGVQVIELEQRIARIEQLIGKFDEHQNTIECLSDDLQQQYNERENFESLYYNIISLAKQILLKNTVSNFEAESSHSIRSINSNASELSNNVQSNSIKLPTIEIPKFNGNYDVWLEFRDTFSSLIHANNNINNINKFHYLKASLKEGAAEVIKSIEVSSENYGVAWEILCARYNNTRLLVQNHVKAIFELENIQKESAFKTRKLIDSVSKHLRSLKQLKQPTEHWDTLIIFIVTSKLDSVSIREWEKYKGKLEDLPTLNNLNQFLKGRADLLETLDTGNTEKAKPGSRPFQKPRIESNNRNFFTSKISCSFCKKSHFSHNCGEFLKMNVRERMQESRKRKLCINCLRGGHNAEECRYGTCRKCDSKHNTLLHEDTNRQDNNTDTTEVSLSTYNLEEKVLLSTAYVDVIDKYGHAHTVRVLLDSGSQSSFITTELCNRLNLDKLNVNISVTGLNHTISKIQFKCNVIIRAVHNQFKANITCLALDKITNDIPNLPISRSSFNIPVNIKLADPNFHKPDKIDILVGADLFWQLICPGQISLGTNKPILQKTRFGWVISGPIGKQNSSAVQCNFSQNLEMQRQLARFWEIEECSHIKPVSKEEHACEEHFLKNTRRAADGRFIVSIPFKENPENLGDSKQQAQKRFWYLEKKLNSNNSFRERYFQFMAEYENLGHMTLAENTDDTVSYYMPHHGIIREESLTTKLRVVFDASAATSNGLSLNDLQMVGPTIQDDLLSIILRFRKHAYVISADITKMYRQVLIDPNQRSLQKILWRKNSSDPLQTYILNTVTYGTTSAPYLAIRCLVETAHNVRETYPDIAEIIEHDFYVDDLLTGANTVESAICIGKQISSALISSGFELRKWRSNNCYITQNLSNDNYQHKIEQALDFGEGQSTKTLGLVWSCDLDVLKYKINANTNNARITKRSILSNTAQIFDPLGLLSPCTIIAKMLLQKLWAEKISWDESVPLTLHTIWMNFRRELPLLNDLKIQRHIICKNATRIELHGFSDSSLNAYGSSLYIRSENKNGEVFVHLLCAKSKVAPLKSLTIPRLELCGALILARLVNKALTSLKINFHKCTFWSDSTIVLGWLKTSPSLLKPFVNNRVAEIQDLTDVNNWRHVSTKDNPADLLSRGVNPSEIKNSSLWWYGPPWLLENENNWPNYNVSVENLPELRTQVQTFLSTSKNDLFQFERFSNLNRIKRTMAFILRFRHNCQISKSLRRLDSLTSSDIKEAFEVLIQLAQKEMFAREHNSLSKGEPLHSKSKLLNLNPFIDSHGIIRVGGRLRHSNYPFEKKHPILLSHKHHLTKLIFNHEHIRLLHAGPQLLLSSIREEFWSTGGRNLAKGTVRKCVVCFRHNSRQIQPIMGDLPESRLHSGIPFNFTGVDYAGPFSLKERKGRGSKFTKSWICLFVCFATKAIHLELVSDISTESFILALRRFTARRGKPAHIYSDNGKNFVGANTELKSLGSFLVDNTNKLENLATAEGITWHFIPAYSPHFGGIWEAGVKATKHHLKRVMGNAFLTFEEFYSLLVQIESILNSRPLSPLSSDPNDLIPLTPAHFLVGRTLTSVPDPDVQHIPDSRLSRYQRIQQLKQHFWVRWSKEYIAEMQVRSRWKNNQGQLKEGAMVLVKEDNLPPLKWRLGRITQLYPGEDGTARVAQIQTEKGMIRRAYSKICPLPEEELPIERQPFQGGGHVNN